MCLCVNSVDQFTKATLQKAGTCNCYVIKYQMELHLSWENNRCLLEWSATTTHDVKERLHTNTQRDRDGWIHLKLINAILVRSVNIKNIVDLLFFLLIKRVIRDDDDWHSHSYSILLCTIPFFLVSFRCMKLKHEITFSFCRHIFSRYCFIR